jgi:predicted transcriptional regulator
MSEPNVSGELTELQLELLDVLWSRTEATVADVREALNARRDLASTTIATLLSRLERRGVITHRVVGRQYVYRPLVSMADVRQSMVSALTDRLFSGNVAELLNHLITEAEIAPGDLASVKKLIAERAASAEEGP